MANGDDKPAFDPSQPFQAGDAKPPFDPTQAFTAGNAQAEPSWGQTALDVAKQVPAGLAVGLENLPGAIPSLIGMAGRGIESGVRALGLESPEVAEQIRQREALKQQIQSGMPTLEKAGLIPEPETTTGQYARTASEFVPAALSGPGGVTRRILTGAVAPGVASEAAGQATAGTEYEPYARVAASFMPFGRVRPGEVKPSFDSEELFASGRQRYQQVDALDAQWKPEAIANLGDQLDASLSRNFNRTKNDAVYSVVDQLRALRDVEAPEGGKAFVSAGDIDAARAQLRDAASDHSQSAAAWKAVNMLDDYMAKTPQRDMLQGNAQQVSKLLGAARDDWSAAYRTQIAQGKILLGNFNAATANSGLNVDNSLRQAIKQLVRPNAMGEIPARKLGYNDEEIAAMERFAKGTVPRNTLRRVGNLLGGGGGLGQSMLGVAAGGAGYLYGGEEGGVLGALLPVVGAIARRGANRVADSEAASLAALISRRSTLGRATPSVQLPSQAPQLGMAAALRAGTAPEDQQRKAGGRVKQSKLATKSEAHYRGGNAHWACAWCTMFVKPSSCTSVRGHISPRALCDFYEPEKGHERLVDNKHDVVTGANSSKKPNGTIFIDRHIPEWSPTLRTKDGKRVRLWTYLSVHEDIEQRLMEEEGETYDKAHEAATLAEQKKAEADGVNWTAYTKEIDKYLEPIEREKASMPPEQPLHVKPEAALKGEGHHHSTHKRPRRQSGGGVEGPPSGDPFSVITKAPVLQINPAPGLTGQQGGPGITGYTASKADFDKFDPAFIGTGMGHNYNGEGFYFSESPGYAQSMRENYFPQGTVYKTKINAEPNEMFDLDAPASSSMVNTIKNDLGAEVRSEVPDRIREKLFAMGKVSNRDVYNALQEVDTNTFRNAFNDPHISTPEQGTSRYLSSLGFKGNTYTDAYGRHHVVFDPKNISILEKR